MTYRQPDFFFINCVIIVLSYVLVWRVRGGWQEDDSYAAARQPPARSPPQPDRQLEVGAAGTTISEKKRIRIRPWKKLDPSLEKKFGIRIRHIKIQLYIFFCHYFMIKFSEEVTILEVLLLQYEPRHLALAHIAYVWRKTWKNQFPQCSVIPWTLPDVRCCWLQTELERNKNENNLLLKSRFTTVV